MDETSNEDKKSPTEAADPQFGSIADRPRSTSGMESSWRDRGFHRDEGSMIGLPEENKKPEEIKFPVATGTAPSEQAA